MALILIALTGALVFAPLTYADLEFLLYIFSWHIEFKIPDTYTEPITLAHLMTHTSGFEERITGLTARGPKDIEPMGEYLTINMPARVHPPGEFTFYSNYGARLAGYIVEEVLGIPFEDYIVENDLL